MKVPMKQCVIAFALALTALLPQAPIFLAQQRRPGIEINDQYLRDGVSRFLRWASYWDARQLEGYVEGKTLEMAIVESSKDVAAFLGEVGIGVVFDRSGRIIAFPGFRPMPNSSAVQKYTANYDGGAEPKRRTDQTIPNTPARQRGVVPAPVPERKEALKVRTLRFTLPKLTPPDSIRFSIKSPELTELKTAIPAALKDWYKPDCGPGEVTIPYFSEGDPWVDVYVDLGACGKGLIYFTHHDESGPWEFSAFWPNRPPDNFTDIIQKIRRNAAETVKLPLG